VWKDDEDTGKRWAEGDLFATTKRVQQGVPHTLCEWLRVEEDANGLTKEFARNCFFWIQRANCPVGLYGVRKRFAFQHCSSKFLDHAVKLVKPRLMLILGSVAAEYFIPKSGKLEELMDPQVDQVQYHHAYNQESCDCIVLYHPSPANKVHYEDSKRHKNSVALARRCIKKLRLGEPLAT
jgi:hypothetical protein